MNGILQKVLIQQIDNINTFEDWTNVLRELGEMKKSGQLDAANIKTIAVDNISELERCILSDLGAKGKNKGVPAMADYQYMQFKLVNSLRYMKQLGCKRCMDCVGGDRAVYTS